MPAGAPRDPKVDALVTSIDPRLREIAQRLRSLIRQNAPGLKESLKWGNPVWVGRTNAICLMLYSEHINLGFFQGARLNERWKELEGTGKGLRHVKVRSMEDADRPVLAKIVRDAVRLDKSSP